MKKSYCSIFLLLVSVYCLSQSTESNLQQIRTKYQQIEDSLATAKKIVLQRTFDSSPELWLLLYHYSYDIDFRDKAKRLILDAVITIFFWKDNVRKIEIVEWDWPDGFFYNITHFYFKNDSIFFSYDEKRQHNYFNQEEPPVSIFEGRYYYKEDRLLKHLTKNFTSSSIQNEYPKESMKTSNRELKLENVSTENINKGYEIMKFLYENGYLNLGGY